MIMLGVQRVRIFKKIACSLHCLGKYEEALICCEKAIKINPMNEIAYINKGF